MTLVTHDSFAASDSVIADFEAQTGVKLNVLKGGDAGAMVNQAILTKDNPLGDALFGVDNTFLSRALDAGIFVPYVSPAASDRCRRVQARPAEPRHADRLRRRVHRLRQSRRRTVPPPRSTI